MRLIMINESDSEIVTKALTGLCISKPFSTKHTIEFKIGFENIDRVKRLLRHHGWQLHSNSEPRKGIVYASATPIKNERYKAPKKLYHITDRTKLPSIAAQGLNLKSETPGMKFPKRLYLYPTEEMAVVRYNMAVELKFFANKKFDDPVLLVIDNSDGRYNAFIDPEYYLGMGGDDDPTNVPIYTTKTIKPSDITLHDVVL